MPHDAFRLGTYEVTPLCDGWAPLPLSDELPGIDVDWDAERVRFPWAFPDDDDASWAWHVHAFLVRHPDGVALVDTGIGHFGRPPFDVTGRVDEELAALGVVPQDVGDVILTHLHADHSGAVCRPDGTPRFPSARHHVHPADWEFFAQHRTAEDFTGRFAMAAIERAGLLNLDAGDHDVGPDLHVRHAPGHTPGHRVIRLHDEDANDTLWLVGDLLHTTPQIAHPGASSEHDEDPELSARHRTDIVEAALVKSWALGVSHFGRPFGRVVGGSDAPGLSSI
ncbi:MAG TPA: MBL fold metallo-hydrolase [Actinomycetota bacterium]|nr:MBL fold metallo-hydrolase [Actinomycetota bacterium]